MISKQPIPQRLTIVGFKMSKIIKKAGFINFKEVKKQKERLEKEKIIHVPLWEMGGRTFLRSEVNNILIAQRQLILQKLTEILGAEKALEIANKIHYPKI